jgi:hypothetical protein
MRFILLIFILVSSSACETNLWFDNFNNQTGFAWVPVYAQPGDLEKISVSNSQPTVKPGKIYVYGNYIFQNDMNKGIHIIDNSVPSQSRKIAFLNIPFSTELAIKGRYLYTNCVSDLLVFELSDVQTPKLIRRVKDAFPIVLQEHPPFNKVYFECPDPSKGIVVDWQEKMMPLPNCRR